MRARGSGTRAPRNRSSKTPRRAAPVCRRPTERASTVERSAPTEGGRDVGENRLDNMGVVGDAELIRHREEQRVGLGDGLVGSELLDENIRLGGVAAAEDRARALADE